MKWLYLGRMVDFSSRKIDKKWKMAWNGSSEELFELWLSRFSAIFWDKSIGNSPIGPNIVKKSILKGSVGQKKSKFWGGRIQNRRPQMIYRSPLRKGPEQSLNRVQDDLKIRSQVEVQKIVECHPIIGPSWHGRPEPGRFVTEPETSGFSLNLRFFYAASSRLAVRRFTEPLWTEPFEPFEPRWTSLNLFEPVSRQWWVDGCVQWWVWWGQSLKIANMMKSTGLRLR